MPQKSFEAQVSDWVRQTQQRIEAVFKESAQRVIEDMQSPVGAGGNMPVDTGFLRRSLQVATTLPAPRAEKGEAGKSYAYDASAYVLTIAGARLGDTLYAVYGANYAAAVEYGSAPKKAGDGKKARRGREGRHYVALAAQKWPMVVQAVARELEASVGAARP